MIIKPEFVHKINQLDPEDNEFLGNGIIVLLNFEKTSINSLKFKALILRLIADIDELVSEQLSLVLRNSKFRKLEANWLGLLSLVSLPLSRTKTRLKLLDMSWAEMTSDLEQSYSMHLSKLYNKIGNQELNVIGGEPFGCICVCHNISMEMDFKTGSEDVDTLDLLAKLGELLLCPFVLGVEDKFFAGSSAEWLVDIARINKILHSEDYQQWQIFRLQQSAKFIGLVLPEFLLRYPYRQYVSDFIFDERNTPLFGSSIFAFASILLSEYQRVSWFGFLKARQLDNHNGSIVNVAKTEGVVDIFINPKSSIRFNNTHARFYADQGFIPLITDQLSGKLYFYGNNSVLNGQGDRDKEILSQIQITLIACRIAHYLKAQSRNILATIKSARECQNFLQSWIDKYSSNVSTVDEAILAKYPISKASVVVNEQDQQGHYHCILKMVPQYHYDAIAIEVLLTTKLEQKGGNG